MVCVGILVPQAVLAADAPKIQDVRLGVGGTLVGQVLDQQGIALVEGQIVLQQQGQQAIVAKTDKNGRFVVHGLRGGIYKVTSGKTQQVFRLWTANVAPPVAKPGALMIVGNGPVVRGAGLAGMPGWALPAAAAAATATAVVVATTQTSSPASP